MSVIDKIAEEIQNALKYDLHFAALALALTLPDVCGKAKYPEAEYPEMKGKKRYVAWFDEYIGEYEKISENELQKIPQELSEDDINRIKRADAFAYSPP